MKGFAGFPEGKVRFTPLPDLFFSQLVPAIDNLAELKVTLHLFWLLHRKKGYPRYASLKELRNDPLLLQGLKVPGRPAEDLLQEGLERAVARGTLLQVSDGQERWYFFNTPKSRQAVEEVLQGELRLEEGVTQPPTVEAERPNIFTLYEQNIALLTPTMAEELKEAEETYPPSWIEEAFQIAVERNARNWRYVKSILERWRQEGKDEGAPKRGSKEDRYRYFKGKYAEYLEE